VPDLAAPLLSFISTVTVALIAGVLSYFAGKGMKRHEWELNLRREKVAVRQRLYAEFLAEADRHVIQSMKEKVSDVTSLYEIIRKFSEIELLSSEEVSAAARSICDYIVSSHAIEGKTRENFYELKQAFIRNAKQEIANYEK